ncbi:hypothetical protein [Ekhidna sp.]|uniref:hypothetical protein n=1 Tax=Ekhidna sp. TaxID=2608089 RepID=UPI003C7A13FD
MSSTTTYINQLSKRLIFYLGGAWVVVESFSFLVQRYDLDPGLIDLLILLILFGFPATLIYSSFQGRWNWKPLLLQVINLVLAFSLIFYYVVHPSILSPDKLRFLKVTKAPTSEVNDLKGIAVLPFLNNMGEDQGYIVAGMHDGLITEIGKLGNLKVVSRTSVMPYKDTKKNIRQIAKELEVDALIETSLTKIDTTIALQVKLINAFPEESIAWTSSNEVSLGAIPNLFREVTKNVALQINKVITPAQQEKLTPQPVLSSASYEAFLRGWYYTGFLTPEYFSKAEKYFMKAIEKDSLIVAAYTGLAGLWASKRQMGYVHPQLARDTIQTLLQEASIIDPDNAEIFAQYGVEQTWGTFEWEKAEKSFRKSIEINPNSAGPRIAFAHHLMIMNQWDEAWQQARYAESLDPESPWVVSFIGIMYVFDGKILTASKYIEKLKKIAPDHPLVVEVNLEKAIALGDYDEAISQLKSLLQRTQLDEIDEFIDKTFAESDFETTISKTAAYLEKKKKSQFIQTRLIFQLYQIAGETDKQMEMLLIMHEEGDPSLPYLGGGPMKALNNHPVFKMVMKDLGLDEYRKQN